ncbi:hypothetical protein OROMI_010311 [Orobanche minor]
MAKLRHGNSTKAGPDDTSRQRGFESFCSNGSAYQTFLNSHGKEAWKVKSVPLDPTRLPNGTKFDVEEDKVMQWRNFIRPQYISIIRPIRLLVHIPSLDCNSFPLAPLSHQSRRLSTTPPLEHTEVTDAGNNLGILRVQFDGAYRWKPEEVAGKVCWMQYEFKTTQMFICAHHCKSEEAPNLLSINLVECTSGKKAIYHALELRHTKLLVVSDNPYFCTHMKSSLLKGCYPNMAGRKRGHEEVDYLKELKSYEAICRILDKLPIGILIKVEQIKSGENGLADTLAALGLQGQGSSGEFHNSIEEVRAEYNRRREEIEKMLAGELKDEEERRLPPLTDTDLNMKAALEIPTATEKCICQPMRLASVAVGISIAVFMLFQFVSVRGGSLRSSSSFNSPADIFSISSRRLLYSDLTSSMEL